MRRSFKYEIGMFLTTQVLALWTGFAMLQAGVREAVVIESTSEGVSLFFTSLLLATAMLILILKYLKFPIIYKLMFAWLIIIGSTTVFSTFLPGLVALGFAFMLAGLRFWKPIVLIQNLCLILAIAGVGPQLAMFFRTTTVLIVLILTSIYDYIAVFKTKHMVKMFEGMSSQGTPFALIIPSKGKLTDSISSEPLEDKKRDPDAFYMVGTGDIAFPAVFAVALLGDFGLVAAIAAIFGSLVGLLVDQYIVESRRIALPALPAISLFAILAFLITLI